ncbi:hypothetical protein [Stenotrophomonas lactitubi]|uniref:hypothetical protein n=1 Tax=Stenotrophomonas lactitubi TaxID=2045214 RepID=UPI00105470F5|nr:hypothetical protein [Stenotrophomonas lactitubi]
MTLVTSPSCFKAYKSPAICDQLRATLQASKSADIILCLLSAYLELTEQNLLVCERASKGWRLAAKGFYGALYSEKFYKLGISTRYNYALAFKQAILANDPGFEPPPFSLAIEAHPHIHAVVNSFESCELNEERRRFWRGWTIRNRKGKPSNLPLYDIHTKYGEAFCDGLYEALAQWYSQTLMDGPVGVNFLTAHLAGQPDSVNPDSFQNSAWMTQFTRELFVAFFKQSHEKSTSMQVIKRQWAELCRTLERHILGVIWSPPDAPIPRPPTPRVHERMRRIKKSKDGTDYKSKLLTDIPLHLEDRAAKEAILERFQRDLQAVESWATAQRSRIMSGYDLLNFLTLEMRHSARPRELNSLPKNATIEEEVVATAHRFEARAMAHVTFPARRIPYQRMAGKVLGIVTSADLLAYSTLLIINHPSITPAFLEELVVVGTSEDPQGTIDIDGCSYLIGVKRRKGPDLAEQRVLLNSTTKKLVDEIVRLTRIQRSILKNEGDENWRRLFLHSATPRHPIRTFDAVKHANTLTDQLAAELRHHCNSDEHARELAERFSLSSLRSSAGTLVYLESGSPQAMSRALGHDTYCPRLLDHYLPRVMREFFEERWIRNVQTSIICQALVGSELQLPASGFTSIKELDEFMHHYALEYPNDSQPSTEGTVAAVDSSNESRKILFNIDQQVMTVLVSLQLAVDQSPGSFGSRAHWWAEISRKIRPDLEERPDLAPVLARAAALADPSIVMGLALA